MKDGKIPSYRNIVNSDPIILRTRLNETLQSYNVKEVELCIFKLATYIQKTKATSVTIMVQFSDQDDSAVHNKSGFYEISGNNVANMQSVEDVKKYLITF